MFVEGGYEQEPHALHQPAEPRIMGQHSPADALQKTLSE